MTKMTIAAMRVNRDMTQEDLGKALGVTKQTVCNWETGKCMTLGALVKLAEFFNVPLDEIDLKPFLK